MIKNFNYKGITIRIKTNLTKDGKVYFGEKDMVEEVVQAYTDASYEKGEMTDEQFLISMYRCFLKRGIKPYEIIHGGLTHEGTTMSDILNQKTLKKE